LFYDATVRRRCSWSNYNVRASLESFESGMRSTEVGRGRFYHGSTQINHRSCTQEAGQAADFLKGLSRSVKRENPPVDPFPAVR
jgi:hypothetical protein